MTKYLLAGIAAFTLTSGVAFAQGTLTDTTTVTHSSTAPNPDGYKSKKTERIIDSNGVETEKTQTYTNRAGQQSSTATTRQVAPDGSVLNTSHEERTTTPFGETTTTTQTQTTTKPQ